MRGINLKFVVCLAILGILAFLPSLLEADDLISVSAPISPGTVPLATAVRDTPLFHIKWYTDHSRANALFLRGDVPILCTGLSVGKKFFEEGVPVKIICSFVSGMTYLVADRPAKNFTDLKGTTIVLPFPGSPIDEVTQFLIKAQRLVPGKDIPLAYAPFTATMNRLKAGQVHAAALPEPFVTMLLSSQTASIAFSYAKNWDLATGKKGGYPQLCLFARPDWAEKNQPQLDLLLKGLREAVLRIKSDPQQEVLKIKNEFPFSSNILDEALSRTHFNLLTGDDLKEAVTHYYKTVGRPLHESFDAFFITGKT